MSEEKNAIELKKYEALNNKLKELTEDELKLVIGGIEMKPTIGLDFGFVDSNCFENQDNQ